MRRRLVEGGGTVPYKEPQAVRGMWGESLLFLFWIRLQPLLSHIALLALITYRDGRTSGGRQ
jgi:hypothetical protein